MNQNSSSGSERRDEAGADEEGITEREGKMNRVELEYIVTTIVILEMPATAW